MEAIWHDLVDRFGDSRGRQAKAPAYDGCRFDVSALLNRNQELEATNRQLALRVEQLETLALR